ncbi:MAG: 3-hydroxyacyl-CoA dehydrogenase [Deltaproteobacteria bacterium]|nr:3-hydroxyacyl-CoA dehydrogenase [Deltaproteobacteria bacterium]NND29269.1 3-hydroxyacyl-CoA dehydrogenase [Myxococcales bacterium]MBT8463539.1 3-hydroxyacyl-CoA dehydrogenase [Deltaproteobacteria bacterium]MBT8483419.1 3-hydroxyacyl-CoA dehydrogenase [Deltaproteobacteria bacterium]NNK08739.1 3-hydroxyacyl-CoA dehydrogenase [Myxococcales bacterium]
MKIAGSVALVTGGASGLGEATVRKLVGQGGRAVIVDLNADRGKKLAAELGDAATYAQADVSNAEEVQAAVDQATSMGTLRAAISCAGIGFGMRTVGKDGTPHDLGVFQKVVSVNLIGTFNVLRLAASAMAKNEPDDGERGVVINTASVAAFDGQIGQVAYSASKGGIVGLTLPAARDLSKAQIRVVTIAPGTFDTPLLASLPDEMRVALAATIPHPSRLGRPEEFGALACHIVENSYLNGEVIRLDGSIRMAPR